MASSSLVVDASVVSKWYLRDEDLIAQADALLTDWQEGRWDFVGPGHFPFEVASALLRARRTGRLTDAEVYAALAHFIELLRGLSSVAPELLVADAVRLASAIGVSFFDACYLQAARNEGVRLVTADAAFYRQAGSQPDVVWLGDYS